jgi:hypothetical protein
MPPCLPAAQIVQGLAEHPRHVLADSTQFLEPPRLWPRINGMRFGALLLLGVPLAFAEDAAAIMARVATNVERTVDARRQYVYQQTVRASLMRTNGQLARGEKRQYWVIPSSTGTEKKLVSFQGEYRRGKQSFTYAEPVAEHENEGIDADLLQDLTEDLVNDKDSRDGIPHNLFPLRSVDLPAYAFTMKGEFEHQGRHTYRIAFEPVKKENCVRIGKEEDSDCVNGPWMGEAWIDAAELEPVRIDTHLASKIPWAVRTFLGTNLKQIGFAITYKRVAENVWFPATYGTEFQVNALFFYKRTITMNLESSGFQKADATSTVEYDLTREPPLR